jgi:hypothetical protein
MVVKHEKSVELIRDSLGRLSKFFSEAKAKDADKKVLASMESELIRMETRLQTYCGYRRSVRCGESSSRSEG